MTVQRGVDEQHWEKHNQYSISNKKLLQVELMFFLITY